jgi:cobalt-precorrin-5B (C1)-methyltransferase
MAAEAGYKRFLIIGHIGKLIKLSGGMMNTHSSEGDCRMELMAAAAIRAGADNVTLNNILNSISTDEAYEHYVNAGIEKACMSNITDKVMYYLNKRADGRMAVDCIIFSNKWGVLGCSAPEDELIACYRLRDR